VEETGPGEGRPEAVNELLVVRGKLREELVDLD